LLLSVMDFGSFQTDCYGGLLGRRSKHHTKAGAAVLGAWSPSLDGDLDPVIEVERAGHLVYVCGTDEACVFWGTQLGYIDS
jgi:hypothetical protein